jgi:exosome complex exonuclease DIS3/RRP44
MDLLKSSSSSTANNNLNQQLQQSNNNNNNSNNKVSHKNRQRRCVIFFPDVHHVETQLSPSQRNQYTNSTVNDLNDAKIRQVAYFFGRNLQGLDVHVFLLSDDKGCRTALVNEVKLLQHQLDDDEDGDSSLEEEEDQYTTQNSNNNSQSICDAISVRDYVKLLEQEDSTISLSDLVANFTSTNSSSSEQQTSDVESQFSYPVHLSQNELSLGVKSGKFFQGTIRAERGSHDRCYVTVKQGDDRVAVSIIGEEYVNRAVDGDVVVIQLNPLDMWIGSQPSGQDDSRDKQTKRMSGAGIAEETAEPSIRDENNVIDAIAVPATNENNDDIDNISDDVSVTEIKKPTGRVVGIIRRNFRKNYCGSIFSLSASAELDDDDAKLNMIGTERYRICNEYEVEHSDGTITCVFFAVDKRIPPVLLKTTQRDRLIGKRILIAVDSWPANSKYPLGHYVQTIGDIGGKDVETEVLLHEHNIPCDPFPAKVLACLPPDDYKIELEPGRLDLRHIPVLSIDPPGCKDIDDALHCVKLPDGNFQVGVHIADVTHYVKAGSAIDLEAANRSTSTYLVNKRLDMLPALLTTDLCSLKGNVDRFAFSVLWKISPEGDIIDVDFCKSIIHSIAALTYQQAQGMIDTPGNGDDHIQVGAVKRLAHLARIFREKRISAGALTLASPEVKFTLDSESLNPTDVQTYQLLEANALVEEFMLLANVTVSKKILRHYPTLSILRRHPAPNRGMFDSLISKAKCRGFSINIEDSKRLADSLDEAILDSDPYFNKLLRILSTRCMSPAQYFCSGEYKPTDWHHYGLAAPVYTHFTSPIRRYADVCVHRLLAAAIGVESLPVHLSSKSYLHDLAANMNRRHRAAQMAGRASVQLHTLLFFSGKDGEKEEDAYVLDVEDDGVEPCFSVMVPRYGIEGRVRIPSVNNEGREIEFSRDPENHRIRFREKNTSNEWTKVQVFDKVRVRIWVNVIQETQKELVLDLINSSIDSKKQRLSKRQKSGSR